MLERFAQPARTAVEEAREEARHRGDRRIGTDHLLIALLRQQAPAQLVGVDAGIARNAADELDRAALAAIGLELGDFEPTSPAPLGGRTSLTAGAKDVIAQTLVNATAEKARRLTTRHMLMALLDRREPDPAAALLAALSIDVGDARRRVTASL